MSDKLIKKKLQTRFAFIIGWFLGGLYLFVNQRDDGSILQYGWWICVGMGCLNLVETCFLIQRQKQSIKDENE